MDALLSRLSAAAIDSIDVDALLSLSDMTGAPSDLHRAAAFVLAVAAVSDTAGTYVGNLQKYVQGQAIRCTSELT